MVFVRAQQNWLPFDFVCAMRALGDRGGYVKISGSGRNALDFHIAFYLGERLQQEPPDALDRRKHPIASPHHSIDA